MKTTKTAKTYKLGNNCFTDSREMHTKYNDDKYTRFFSVFIRTYSPREEVEAFLNSVDFDEYAYIYHDKDVKDGGELKEPHFHILVYRKAGFRLTPAVRSFSQNTLVQPARSRCKSYEYLTHKNDPDKTQYSPSSVCEFHRDDKNTFIHTFAEQRESQFAQMMVDLKQLSRYELACKYGRDYMLNCDRYHRFMEKVEFEQDVEFVDKTVRDINNTEAFTPELADWLACEISDAIQEQGSMPDIVQLTSLYTRFLKSYQQTQWELADRARNPRKYYEKVLGKYEKPLDKCN